MEFAPVLRTASSAVGQLVCKRASDSSTTIAISILPRSSSSRTLVPSTRRSISSVNSSWTPKSKILPGLDKPLAIVDLDSAYKNGAWKRRRYSISAETKREGKGVADASGGGVKLEIPEHLDEQERVVFELLRDHLEPVELFVKDISGGCGSMYGIDITSEKFRGLNMLKQQRLVNSVLGDLIKGWHGVQLKTKAP